MFPGYDAKKSSEPTYIPDEQFPYMNEVILVSAVASDVVLMLRA